jgi:hypothetical protein
MRGLPVLGVLALSCGARTGLSAPCLIPLEREKPAVVFLVEWNAACDNYRGGCSSDSLYEGRDLYEAVRYTLANVVPILDDVARLGAIPTSTVRLVESSRVPDLPDGGDDPAYWCGSPPALTVPIGEGHGAQVERYFSVEEWPHGHEGPNGAGGVLPALPIVERALMAAGNARTPRWILLIDNGSRGCTPRFEHGCTWDLFLDDCTEIDDARYAAIRAVYEALASRDVRTLVVGLRRFTPDGWPYLLQQRILNAEAEGGGLARADDSYYPVHFYDYADVPALEAVLREQIVTPYYCTLYATAPVPDPTTVVMIAPGGGEAPLRDPTHRDGWDFLDTTHRRIGLFGAACDRATSMPARLSLLAAGQECF